MINFYEKDGWVINLMCEADKTTPADYNIISKDGSFAFCFHKGRLTDDKKQIVFERQSPCNLHLNVVCGLVRTAVLPKEIVSEILKISEGNEYK